MRGHRNFSLSADEKLDVGLSDVWSYQVGEIHLKT